MKRVIVLTGMPGSGKSTAAEEFSKLGIPVIGMGDAVRREMRRKGVNINNRTMRLFPKMMTRKHGKKYVINLVKRELFEKLKANRTVILDGVRRMQEIEELKRAGYEPVILCITAGKNIRFKRIMDRGNKSDSLTRKEFEWREKVELGYGIADVIASADFYIDNSGSRREFLLKLRSFVSDAT
ncbi:MAG: dephospho-CoA kinase [Candidatus Parvarchaeota archaeon]